MSHGPFLMVTDSDRNERMLDSKILRVLWDVINAHGIPHGHGECPGAFAGAELTPVLGDGFDSGKQFVIPTIAAALIADLLNGVADYAAACYADGYAKGVDHTRQLASGEMSAADFEDAAVREKAKTVQKHKRYAIRKYSSR